MPTLDRLAREGGEVVKENFVGNERKLSRVGKEEHQVEIESKLGRE
jgi:hypothetical protein